MKIRNRKLVSGIVAVFMAVLMTGIVFAFAPQGPLTFTGTANVDASLALAIVESSYVGTNMPIGGEEPPIGLVLSHEVTATNGSGHRAAAMSAYFDGIDQSVQFNFTVENIGTIAAEITPLILDFTPDSSNRLVWEYQSALDIQYLVLEPSESVSFSFTVYFDTYEVGWIYSGSGGLLFELHYGLPSGPIDTEPAVSPVADIQMIIRGGGLVPVERQWTNFGTRGWEINPIPAAEGGWNMAYARQTGNLNSWHRSQSMQGRDALGEEVINRGNSAPNVTVYFTGTITHPNPYRGRQVTFELNITLEDGSVVQLTGTHGWQDAQGTIDGTGPYAFEAFSSADGRFELLIRGYRNSIREWRLLDTSGVNQ